MKEINLTISIYDDWYYAIEAEYNIAKQTSLEFKDFNSFLNEFITSLALSNNNYDYMCNYLDKHYKYICEKIPDYKRYGE